MILNKYGSVNRGVLGVAFPSPQMKRYFKQQGIALGTVNGVYITNVMSKSAAAEAGLKEGDIIQSIDGTQLHQQSFRKGLLDIDLTI
jgi:S1-C subfamily serine protease